MGRAAAIAITAALWLGVACANDGPPTAFPRESPSALVAQAVQDNEPEAAASQAAVHEPPDEEASEAREPARNRVLIMRLEQDLYVYPRPDSDQYIGDYWRAGGLLLADGWLARESGDVWLRLDMNQERVGWIELADSPLTLDEARTLPEVEAPPLPIVHLQLSTGEVAELTLAGRSQDGRRYAAQFPGSADARFWVHRRALAATENGFDVDAARGLPVYVGPVWGELTLSSGSIAEATHWGWPTFADRPEGEFSTRGLADESHAILGRSSDGEWIALRVSTLHPEYVWVRTDRVDLNQAIDSLPIYVGKWMQTVPVYFGEGASPSGATWEPLYHWQWRDDGTIVGSNSEGLWLWNPATGDNRKFAERQWVKFSPDGRYAVSGCCQNYETGDLLRDVTITSVDSGDPLVFVDANQYRFSHHSEDPSLHWSPDSTHVLSAIHGDAETGVEAKHAILGVDGSRIEVSWRGQVGWLPDGSLYHVSEGVMRIHEPDASLVREIPFVGWPIMHVGVSANLTVVAQAEQHHDGYWLINLNTEERTKLPPPFDLAPRDGNESGWRPLVFANGSLYFYWYTPGTEESPDEPLLYWHDVDTGAAAAVHGSVGFNYSGWPRVQHQCDAGCERFALVAYQGPMLIIDTAREETVRVQMPEGARGIRVIDWSPGGERLLISALREMPEYDEAGFATHSQTWLHNWEYAVSEYLIIDAVNGSILQRLRSPVEQCGTEGHTAAWSPDGRWLAFGGERVDCT